MKEPRKPATPDSNAGSSSEFGAVTIDFNPGPDSRDRLRRLFSLLLEHGDDGQIAPGEGLPDYAAANDGAPAE